MYIQHTLHIFIFGFALFYIFFFWDLLLSVQPRIADLCFSYSRSGDMSGSQLLRALRRSLGLGRQQLKVDSRHVVLITGCDSGLG